MSAKMIALAAEIVDTNPAGSQLIVSLTKAENGVELVEALDAYDAALLDSVTEVVQDEYVESSELVSSVS